MIGCRACKSKLSINADIPLISVLQTTITSQRIRTPIPTVRNVVNLTQDG